ncbi:hypothetical protein, partial [Sphingobium sp. Z007]|uniref:hypothetical protein n=1 Tax=Sphingobium sp. Z007 TaxID=627495 RepID=UPI001C3D2EDA
QWRLENVLGHHLLERRTPRILAGFAALNSNLQLPSRALILQHFRPVLQHHIVQDLGHGLQILQGLP